MSDVDLLRNRLFQEIAAREQTQTLLEKKTLELSQANQFLKSRESRYRVLSENCLIGIWQIDMDELIEYVNPTMCALLGIGDPSEVMGRPYDTFISTESLKDTKSQRKRWFFGGSSTCELEMISKTSRRQPAVSVSSAPLLSEKGKIEGLVMTVLDVTEKKEAVETIRKLALNDALTGLPNRNLFHQYLSNTLKMGRRLNQPVLLMSLDLDKFKTVNDTYGHAIGDALLMEVAVRIKNDIRETDIVARLGGDEFGIILPNMKNTEILGQIVSRIIEDISKPFLVARDEIFIGASIGITVFPDDGEELSILLRNADMAMYKAKEEGRNTYRCFAPEMTTRAIQRTKLDQDLRRAIGKSEFVIHYQPIIDIETSRIKGAEALVRWDHPKRGMVLPSDFIPLAEETGLIKQVGLWVLEMACAQAKEWEKTSLSKMDVSVNMSSQQLRLGLSLKHIEKVLSDTGLSPEKLTLEITETLFLDDTEQVIQWLYGVRKMGVQLSVDDFGTGYSSLSYLKRLPINTVKIDRSFIKDLQHDSEEPSLIKAIISMADSLDLKVVAEGVESLDQSRCLARLGCRYMQGYYYGKPMSAGKFPLDPGINKP